MADDFMALYKAIKAIAVKFKGQGRLQLVLNLMLVARQLFSNIERCDTALKNLIVELLDKVANKTEEVDDSSGTDLSEDETALIIESFLGIEGETDGEFDGDV